MPNAKFDGGNVVLVDPDAGLRDNLSGVFHKAGLTSLISADALSAFSDAVERDLVDLIVCNADMDGGAFGRMLQAMRSGHDAINPYAVTIGVTAQASETHISGLINAGIDGVVLKSYLPQALINRINGFVLQRKAFVVTPSYIGPDRRMGSRPQDDQTPLLPVPNSLRERATGAYDGERLRYEIARANTRINGQRRRQNALMIGRIVQQILPLFQAGAVDDQVMVHLKGLKRLADDLSNRLEGDETARITTLCSSLSRVLDKLLATLPTPEQKDVQVLKELALAIQKEVRGADESDVAGEIATSIRAAKRFS